MHAFVIVVRIMGSPSKLTENRAVSEKTMATPCWPLLSVTLLWQRRRDAFLNVLQERAHAGALCSIVAQRPDVPPSPRSPIGPISSETLCLHSWNGRPRSDPYFTERPNPQWTVFHRTARRGLLLQNASPFRVSPLASYQIFSF